MWQAPTNKPSNTLTHATARATHARLACAWRWPGSQRALTSSCSLPLAPSASTARRQAEPRRRWQPAAWLWPRAPLSLLLLGAACPPPLPPPRLACCVQRGRGQRHLSVLYTAWIRHATRTPHDTPCEHRAPSRLVPFQLLPGRNSQHNAHLFSVNPIPGLVARRAWRLWLLRRCRASLMRATRTPARPLAHSSTAANASQAADRRQLPGQRCTHTAVVAAACRAGARSGWSRRARAHARCPYRCWLRAAWHVTPHKRHVGCPMQATFTRWHADRTGQAGLARPDGAAKVTR